jgi:cytosine/uracil/thiamine/allantoin permease
MIIMILTHTAMGTDGQVAGNAVSGGIDLAALLPKYINIRRGGE